MTFSLPSLELPGILAVVVIAFLVGLCVGQAFPIRKSKS